MQPGSPTLLTAHQVQQLLDVDKTTVYRMAGDGRLPAVRVGRQWRFPAEEIRRLFDVTVPDYPDPAEVIDCEKAEDIVSVVAEALGVMMVVTDVTGVPVTKVVNPSRWLEDRLDEPEVLAECLSEWQAMAEDLDLAPRFQPGVFGFECARAFIRSGTELVGMVLAGGIQPSDPTDPADAPDSGFYRLDRSQRRRVLDVLPRLGALLSRQAVRQERNTP